MSEDENKNNIVIMDFMATWCGPCKIQDPILEELKRKFKDKIAFKKIDVDEESDIANEYSIRAVPTLIIEKDKKVFAKYVGVTGLKVLVDKIDEALR